VSSGTLGRRADPLPFSILYFPEHLAVDLLNHPASLTGLTYEVEVIFKFARDPPQTQ